jgi:hypothetical protein
MNRVVKGDLAIEGDDITNGVAIMDRLHTGHWGRRVLQ